MDVSLIVEQLQGLQVRRSRMIKATNKVDNAAGGVIRSELGFRPGLAEHERNRIARRAERIRGALYAGGRIKDLIEAGKEIPTKLQAKAMLSEDDQEIARLVAVQVEVFRQMRKPAVEHREQCEAAMVELARQLPVWQWTKTVVGFGDLALAVMIGEAGDLSSYPSEPNKRGVDCLWKRFGLTPYQGRAAPGTPRDAISKEEWTVWGYAPKRNAESYAVLGDPLFRHQSKVGGPYRAVYDREKARFLTEGKTNGHAHMHGLRCMRKAALKDLWRVWRGLAPKERQVLGHDSCTDEAKLALPGPGAKRSGDGLRSVTGNGHSSCTVAAAPNGTHERAAAGQMQHTRNGQAAITGGGTAERPEPGQQAITDEANRQIPGPGAS